MQSCAACFQRLCVGAPHHGTYKLDAATAVLACSPVCAQIGIACALIGMPTQKRSADDAELVVPAAKAVPTVSEKRALDAQRVRSWAHSIDALLASISLRSTISSNRVLGTVAPIGNDVQIPTDVVVNQLASLAQALRALEQRILTPELDYSFDTIAQQAGNIIANVNRQVSRQRFDADYPGARAPDSYLSPAMLIPGIFDQAIAYVDNDNIDPGELVPTVALPAKMTIAPIVALGRDRFYIKANRTITGFTYGWLLDNAGTYLLDEPPRGERVSRFYEFRGSLCQINEWLNASGAPLVVVGPSTDRRRISTRGWYHANVYLDTVTEQFLAVKESDGGQSFQTYSIGADWKLRRLAARTIPTSTHIDTIFHNDREHIAGFYCGIIVTEVTTLMGDFVAYTLIDLQAGTFQRFNIFLEDGRFKLYPIGNTHVLVSFKQLDDFAEEDGPKNDYVLLIDRATLPSAGVLPLSEYNGDADKIVDIIDIAQYGRKFTPTAPSIERIYVDTDRFYLSTNRAEIYMFLLNQL